MATGGCGHGEVLEPLRGPGPPGIDFSGSWRMQDDFNAMRERIDSAIRKTDGVDERELLRGVLSTGGDRRRSGGAVGGLVHVFLENGENLRITQTDAGLFIAFDRSVVEEYRFGEARMMSTGGARAQRVSGWDGRSYVIETLDEHGMKLTERYSLGAGGQVLTRHIVLRGKDMVEVPIVQTFNRVN